MQINSAVAAAFVPECPGHTGSDPVHRLLQPHVPWPGGEYCQSAHVEQAGSAEALQVALCTSVYFCKGIRFAMVKLVLGWVSPLSTLLRVSIVQQPWFRCSGQGYDHVQAWEGVFGGLTACQILRSRGGPWELS